MDLAKLHEDRIVFENALQEFINMDKVGIEKVLKNYNFHGEVTPENIAKVAANHPGIKKDLYMVLYNAEIQSTNSFNEPFGDLLNKANETVNDHLDSLKGDENSDQDAGSKPKFSFGDFSDIVDGLGETFKQINIFSGKGGSAASELKNNADPKLQDNGSDTPDPDPDKGNSKIITYAVLAVVIIVAVGLAIRYFRSKAG